MKDKRSYGLVGVTKEDLTYEYKRWLDLYTVKRSNRCEGQASVRKLLDEGSRYTQAFTTTKTSRSTKERTRL